MIINNLNNTFVLVLILKNYKICTHFAHFLHTSMVFVYLCLHMILKQKDMPKRELFQTAEELITGYRLPVHEHKAGRKAGITEPRKVLLRTRILKSGNVQMYLYSSVNGNVIRKSVGVLNIETDYNIKSKNETAVRLAMAEADIRNADALRTGIGLRPVTKRQITLIDYIESYMETLIEDGRKTGTYYNYKDMLRHVVSYRGKYTRFCDVDTKWISGFIAYLKQARTERGPHNILSENTQRMIFFKLEYIFNKAARESVIVENPFNKIEPGTKPKKDEDRRCYLTIEEVKRLIETPCGSEDVKRAFLFAVFVGLRWSDLKQLRWSDFSNDDNGTYLYLRQKKTKDGVKPYLSETAKKMLPQKPKRCNINTLVFPSLPSNCSANRTIKKMAKRAGIKKDITFHVSRHSCATILLNVDTPIEVVSRHLGHRNISTTQIYARVMNKTVARAVMKQDEAFNESSSEK